MKTSPLDIAFVSDVACPWCAIGLAGLDKALARGWVGQYYSPNLADWPQFDALRADPRYAAIQRRIDARIAKERAEVIALR